MVGFAEKPTRFGDPADVEKTPRLVCISWTSLGDITPVGTVPKIYFLKLKAQAAPRPPPSFFFSKSLEVFFFPKERNPGCNQAACFPAGSEEQAWSMQVVALGANLFWELFPLARVFTGEVWVFLECATGQSSNIYCDTYALA